MALPPRIQPIVAAEEVTAKDDLAIKEVFAGLFDAKGVFRATLVSRGSKVTVTPYMVFICDAEDLPFLEKVQRILGFGHISPLKTPRGNPAKYEPVDSRYVFRVTKLKDLLTKVMPLFQRYPLIFQHHVRAFPIFHKLCLRLQNKEHWCEEGLMVIKEEVRELNACRYGFLAESTPDFAKRILEQPRLKISIRHSHGIFAANGFFRAELQKTGTGQITGVDLSVWLVCSEENLAVLHHFQKKWGLHDRGGQMIQKLGERQMKVPGGSQVRTQTAMALVVKNPLMVVKVINYFWNCEFPTAVQKADYEAFRKLADYFLAQAKFAINPKVTNNFVIGHMRAHELHQAPEKWQALVGQMKGYSNFFRKFVA